MHGHGDGRAEFSRGSSLQPSERDNPKRTRAQPLDAVYGAETDVKQSSKTCRHFPRHEETPPSQSFRQESLAGTGGSGVETYKAMDLEGTSGFTPICCVIGKKTKDWTQTLPVNKFRNAVEEWQILTFFSSIAGAKLPASYSLLLSLIDVFSICGIS